MPVLFDLDAPVELAFQQIVTLSVETPIQERGSWLPLAALKEGRKGLWSVLIVASRDGQTTVQAETVEVLHMDGEQAFVRGTLPADAKVVSTGGHRVVSGQPVALKGS